MPLIVGLTLGGVLLIYLRRRRLRWTWALLLVPVVCGAWLLSWRAGLGLASTTGVAGFFGAHLHLDAIGRGGEEARIAREAIGPFVALRSIIAERGARRRPRKGATLAIGRSVGGGICRVPMGAVDQGHHVLVPGSTGGGKTVTQSAIVHPHVEAGMAGLVLDPKPDPSLLSTMEAAAVAAGVPFRLWSPSGSLVYNPLAYGDPDEVADKALAAHEWTEPHYEMATRRLLGLALETMKAVDQWPPTLSTLVDAMDPERLERLADRAGEELGERVRAYLDGLDARARADLRGGRDRLAILAESELGRRLDPTRGEGDVLDLRRALARGEVVYFSLEADRYPIAARLLTAALVMDLASLASGWQGGANAAVVLIDEFGSLATPQVSRLMARCRGAGISLVLGTQSLSDLRGVGTTEDALLDQVITNVSYVVSHRVPDPDSAEYLARMAGTAPAWTRTEQMGGGLFSSPQGAATRKRERDFVIGPDAFKRLRPGEAIVIRPTASPPAEVVFIWRPRRGPRR